MQALILAGGFGTRLRSVVADLPKPMAPVNNRPFLEYLVLQLRRYHFHEVIFSTGYKGETVESYFGNGDHWGMSFHYSNEDQPLGTAGAVKLAERFVGDSGLIVLNGDSLFDIDIVALTRFHQEHEAQATIALATVDNADRYGTVEINEGNEIVQFLEKTPGKAGYVNGGIYVFNRKVLDLIPGGQEVSMERDIFPQLINKGFYGMPFPGFLVDIGTPESYQGICDNPRNLLAAIGE